MTTITLQEAKNRLDELIRHLMPGEELVITENDRPVAKLVAAPLPEEPNVRRLGTQRGSVLYMAPDFDAPLEDFREYTE